MQDKAQEILGPEVVDPDHVQQHLVSLDGTESRPAVLLDVMIQGLMKITECLPAESRNQDESRKAVMLFFSAMWQGKTTGGIYLKSFVQPKYQLTTIINF